MPYYHDFNFDSIKKFKNDEIEIICNVKCHYIDALISFLHGKIKYICW